MSFDENFLVFLKTQTTTGLAYLLHDKIKVENTDFHPDLSDVEGVVQSKNYDDSDHKYNVGYIATTVTCCTFCVFLCLFFVIYVQWLEIANEND